MVVQFSTPNRYMVSGLVLWFFSLTGLLAGSGYFEGPDSCTWGRPNQRFEWTKIFWCILESLLVWFYVDSLNTSRQIEATESTMSTFRSTIGGFVGFLFGIGSWSSRFRKLAAESRCFRCWPLRWGSGHLCLDGRKRWRCPSEACCAR